MNSLKIIQAVLLTAICLTNTSAKAEDKNDQASPKSKAAKQEENSSTRLLFFSSAPIQDSAGTETTTDENSIFTIDVGGASTQDLDDNNSVSNGLIGFSYLSKTKDHYIEGFYNISASAMVEKDNPKFFGQILRNADGYSDFAVEYHYKLFKNTLHSDIPLMLYAGMSIADLTLGEGFREEDNQYLPDGNVLSSRIGLEATFAKAEYNNQPVTITGRVGYEVRRIGGDLKIDQDVLRKISPEADNKYEGFLTGFEINVGKNLALLTNLTYFDARDIHQLDELQFSVGIVVKTDLLDN